MRTALVTVLAVLALGLTVPPATAGGGGGCHMRTPTTASGDTVTMDRACFHPTILHTEPGTTVRFVNEEALAHLVTGLGATIGGMDRLREGEEVAHAFDEPGIHPYDCALHPGMVGAVVVADRDADGEVAAALPTAELAAASPSRRGTTGPVGLVAALLLAATFAGGVVLVRRRS